MKSTCLRDCWPVCGRLKVVADHRFARSWKVDFEPILLNLARIWKVVFEPIRFNLITYRHTDVQIHIRPPNIIKACCTFLIRHPYRQTLFTIHYNLLFGLLSICDIGLFSKRHLERNFNLGEFVRLEVEVASDGGVLGLATLC